MIVVTSPSLRARGLELARGLNHANLLREFVTTIGWRPDRWWIRSAGRLNTGLSRELQRRSLPLDLGERVHSFPWEELVRVASNRVFRAPVLTDQIWWWAERSYDRHVANRWSGKVPCIYGFELSSLETFRRQRQSGGRCILSQPIAHHRVLEAILARERKLFPDATTSYDDHLRSRNAEINAVKDEELDLADLVIAQSDYVAETLIEAGIAKEKIISLPSAAPLILPARTIPNNGPVVFLSAGSHSLRKGTHYLLEAWKALGENSLSELWMVGDCSLPERLFEQLPGRVMRSRAVPKAQLYDLYRKASVLVLPTLAEGFAYVILEAMAAGLPIITTRNSGCGSFVADGCNGWVIPAGDSSALQEKMEWCLRNPTKLDGMGRASRERAARWTWDDFNKQHTAVINRFVADL